MLYSWIARLWVIRSFKRIIYELRTRSNYFSHFAAIFNSLQTWPHYLSLNRHPLQLLFAYSYFNLSSPCLHYFPNISTLINKTVSWPSSSSCPFSYSTLCPRNSFFSPQSYHRSQFFLKDYVIVGGTMAPRLVEKEKNCRINLIWYLNMLDKVQIISYSAYHV